MSSILPLLNFYSSDAFLQRVSASLTAQQQQNRSFVSGGVLFETDADGNVISASQRASASLYSGLNSQANGPIQSFFIDTPGQLATSNSPRSNNTNAQSLLPNDSTVLEIPTQAIPIAPQSKPVNSTTPLTALEQLILDEKSQSLSVQGQLASNTLSESFFPLSPLQLKDLAAQNSGFGLVLSPALLEKIQELRNLSSLQERQGPERQRFLTSQNPFAAAILAGTFDNDFFLPSASQQLDVDIDTGSNPDNGNGSNFGLSLQAGLNGENDDNRENPARRSRRRQASPEI